MSPSLPRLAMVSVAVGSVILMSPAVASAGVDWTPIIACESGGNPRAQNPVSTASGLFQFLDTSWAAYGGNRYSSRAKDATVAQQYEIANNAYTRSGLSPWAASQSCWGGRVRTTPPGGLHPPSPPRVKVVPSLSPHPLPPPPARRAPLPSVPLPPPPPAPQWRVVIVKPWSASPLPESTLSGMTAKYGHGESYQQTFQDNEEGVQRPDHSLGMLKDPNLLHPNERIWVR